MKKIKSFKIFLQEGVEIDVAEPTVKPITKPGVKPNTVPGRPSPIRRDKPSINPRPKATVKEVANKFLELSKGDKEIENFLKNKYSK